VLTGVWARVRRGRHGRSRVPMFQPAVLDACNLQLHQRARSREPSDPACLSEADPTVEGNRWNQGAAGDDLFYEG
jgi:hypothetical protein